MRKLFIGSALISLLLGACVPNKKIVYVQKNDVNKQLPKDTVVREYDLADFKYKVQSQDALYVRFESITDEKFDFLSRQGSTVGTGQNFIINSEIVDQDGIIEFPQLGKIKVSGLTVFEVQSKLQEIANQYLEQVVVKVRLVNFRFTLLGEVNVEGTTTTFNNRVTILEAIGLAGGLKDLADRSNVKIIRLHEGQAEVGYVNLLDEKIVTSPFYYVHQNDVIIVPALKQRPFRNYFGPNLSLVLSSMTVILLAINLTK